MAVFTAVNTDGETRWNQWKTWAAADPGGGEGSQYPGAADSFVVPNTKTVLVKGQYPAAGSIGGGDCSVSTGGTLTFDHTTNTRLLFGNVSFNNSGTVNMGTAANPIGAAYTCELLGTPAGDGGKNILNIAHASAAINVYGHADFYGGLHSTYLFAAWNGADLTIQVEANWSSIPDNTEIWIHKNRAYGTTGYTNDLGRAFVNYGGGASPPAWDGTKTTITIDGLDVPGVAASSWLAGGRVVVVSRNVTIGLNGASRAVGNVNALRPSVSAGVYPTTSGQYNLHNCEFLGCAAFTTYGWKTNNVIVRNGRIALIYNGYWANKIGLGLEQSGTIHRGYLTNYFSIGNRQAIGFLYGSIIDGGEFYAHPSLLYSTTYAGVVDSIINDGYIFSNSYALLSCSLKLKNCFLGWNSNGDNIDNVYDFYYSSPFRVDMKNVKMPASLSETGSNSLASSGRVICQGYNQTLNAVKIFDTFGTVEKKTADGTGDTPSVARTAYNDQVLEVTPYSYCANSSVLNCYGSRSDPILLWGTSGTAMNLKLYIQSEYTIAAADIKLFCRYLNGTGGAMTEIESTEGITVRSGDTDWSQYLSTGSFTPGADGWVEVWAELYAYSAATDYVYIDPLLDGVTAGSTVRWEDGYPVIQEPSGGGTGTGVRQPFNPFLIQERVIT